MFRRYGCEGHDECVGDTADMTVVINVEPFSRELSAEIAPLAQKCWNESTVIKAETCAFYGERDFQIEPDVDRYELLASQGFVVMVTLRNDAEIKGYVIGLVYRSMHHKHILCGIGDTAYLEPDYRAYMAPVANRFEQEMRSRGVGIIGWPTHAEGPVYEVLKALGYVGDDIVMEKRLCA